MNILIDRLPEKVRVGSTVYDLNTDFRAGIEFEVLVEGGEMKVFPLLKPYFPGGIPENENEAVEAVLWFYRCGAEPQGDTPNNGKPAYSFSVDSSAIYADFFRYYGIDLSCEEMHWWAFRALLMGLPENSAFKQRIYYRTCKLSDLPKKERERVSKIRKEIAIEAKTGRKLTLEERNQKMRDYVLKRSTTANAG